MSAEDQKLDLGGDLDLGMDLPEIPTDVEKPETVEDTFDSAVKFSFLGVGHGGSNIVKVFHDIGYKRACIVNTAKQDLDDIALPDANKLWLGAGGAAKDRKLGDSFLRSSHEELVDFMRCGFGPDYDRIMICATAGGGTGSGGFPAAIEAARDITTSLRIQKAGEPTKVGLMLVLPSNSEKDRMHNAYEAMHDVMALVKSGTISPVVIIDNERARELFPGATLGTAHDRINKSIAQTFHLFNLLSQQSSSEFTAFDPADYRDMLNGGIMAYGGMGVSDTSDQGIAKTIRENLKANVLCGNTDLSVASSAACLLLGTSNILRELPAAAVDNAYEMLARMISSKGKIHRGIYGLKNRQLAAYTLISGLGMPAERCSEIARMAGHADWDD